MKARFCSHEKVGHNCQVFMNFVILSFKIQVYMLLVMRQIPGTRNAVRLWPGSVGAAQRDRLSMLPTPPATTGRQGGDTLVETIESLQAENARLHQQVELYQQALNVLSTGIHMYRLEALDDDRTLRLVAANPAVGELTGVAPESIIGKTLDENFPGLREQGVPQAYANVVRTGEPLAFETVYGDEQVIESAFGVRAVALPDQHMLVMFDNITQRKQAEANLRQLNEALGPVCKAMIAWSYGTIYLKERTVGAVEAASSTGKTADRTTES
jgi:PAS domain-containing protein